MTLPDGVYVTPHGSKVTISNNGSACAVEFDWLEEDACCDCEASTDFAGEFLTWTCIACNGGSAPLTRLQNGEDV